MQPFSRKKRFQVHIQASKITTLSYKVVCYDLLEKVIKVQSRGSEGFCVEFVDKELGDKAFSRPDRGSCVYKNVRATFHYG